MTSNENSKSSKASLLKQWKKRKKETTSSMLSPRPTNVKTVPSKGQERLWILQELNPHNPFYQYAHQYTIHGNLDCNILNKSFKLLIKRHEILRTNFVKEPDGLFTKLNQTSEFSSKYFDLRVLDHKEQYSQTQQLISQESLKVFDLKNDLLIRVCIIQLHDDEYKIILSMHHIVGDRWSLNLMNETLFVYYKQLVDNAPIEEKPLAIQYADYAHWQKGRNTKPEDLNYWIEHLAGELPLLDLPTDHPRPNTSTFKGDNVKIELTEYLSTKLFRLAKDSEVTMFTLMLSVFKVLLFRYTNQNEIIIGSPFSNRDKGELEKLVGFFNETLVLRTKIEKGWNFQDLLSNVKHTTLSALEHKDVPFDEIVRGLQVERHRNTNPIFQAMFLYNKVIPLSTPDLDLKIEEEMIDLGVSKFDLTLFVNEQEKNLSLNLEYALDLLEEDTAIRLMQHFEILLESIVSDSTIQLSAIPMITKDESQKILHEWNDTNTVQKEYSNIHELIEGTAILYPHNPAVVFQNNQLTYNELDTQANAVAHRLLEVGVKRNEIIGLFADRGVHMIIGILGILKAGAAYLPLDPDYPQERINYMIEDSKTKVVLKDNSSISHLNNAQVEIIRVEECIEYIPPSDWKSPISNSDDLAYVIYTSGSTGKPKGVLINHKNLLHSTQARNTFYTLIPKAFLLLSSFSFDSSVAGIFWTLCTGGNLVLTPKRIEQDVHQLCNLISKHKISHTLMLPSLYKAILSHVSVEQLHSLKVIILAGEAIPLPLISKHFNQLPNTGLYNEYGPTEASVWCIAHKMKGDEKKFVPIGKPIPNAEAYILNEAHQLCPIGTIGELYIGGLGVAKGYLNRSDLTNEKFVTNPYKQGQKLYKTGDIARFHKDGKIEFLGRIDHQVKIRGYRVELDEIRNKILDFSQLNEVLVVVHSSHDNTRKELIAYVTGEADIDYIKSNLGKQLPAYMIPAKIIKLDEFDKLPNGKINRKGLPSPDNYQLTDSSTYEAPKSDIEVALTDIWKDLLGVEKVGVHDNFFALGGDSILSIQVVSRARDIGIILTPNQLFEYQTIQTLALSLESKKLDQKQLSTQPNEVEMERLDKYPLSPLQNVFLFNSQSNEFDSGLLQLEFTLRGDIDNEIFEKSWEKSALKHDAMRTYINEIHGASPLQVIDRKVKLNWEYLDWQEMSVIDQKEALSHLRKTENSKGIELSKAPAYKLFHIKLKQNKSILFWTCHHIFLDGWSCGIILKDALKFYMILNKGVKVDVEPTPNFLSYLKWNDNRDQNKEVQFWRQSLKEFTKPQLFEKSIGVKPKFEDDFLKLTKNESQTIRDFSKLRNVSVSTSFQGLWALLISKYFDTDDVVYGVTVSGRFTDFPNIEDISGLFMNVIPNRVNVKKNSGVYDWLKMLQREQGKVRPFENTPLEQIKSSIQWPTHLELFETLFVYGNFLKDGLIVGDIDVEHFAGGFSSGYPLTIRVNPLQEIEIDFRYDNSRISKDQIKGLKADLYKLIKEVENIHPSTMIVDVLDGIYCNSPISVQKEFTPIQQNKTDYIAPRTNTEKELSKIWESLFNLSNISIKDDFFDLGGKSLMAIQLFGEIERKMKIILPPSSLFKYSSIEDLASAIDGNTVNTKAGQTLIALRSDGIENPLFCIHGGGAHVFFYKLLTDYLPIDLPVYSFQPPGLDGGEDFPETIEAMASQYIDKMKSIQKTGPYRILGTCFSNAVVLEMAHQMKDQGDIIEKLFFIDSAPVHLFGNNKNKGSQTLSRFFDMLKRGDFSRIKNKISNRFSKKEKLLNDDSFQESNSNKQLQKTIENLNELYADYKWRPIENEIYFIRSKEFNDRTDKNYHLIQWKKLAKGGVNLHVVPGQHLTLFEDPEVKGLASKLSECLELNTI